MHPRDAFAAFTERIRNAKVLQWKLHNSVAKLSEDQKKKGLHRNLALHLAGICGIYSG